MEALLEQRIQYYERLLSTKTRSPIVVQLASLYLEAGRPHDALRYCDNAIAHFPYYTTAHLVRAQVLSALEMNAEARRELEFVHSILPDVKKVKSMLDQIPASETEMFEEPTESGEIYPSAQDESLEVLESAPEASEEAESPLPEEETPDDHAIEDSPASSEIEPAEGVESRAEFEVEGDGTAAEQPQEAREEDPFGLGPSEKSPPTAQQTTPFEEDTTSSPVEPVFDEENTFGDLGSASVGLETTGAAESTGKTGEGYDEFAEAMRSDLTGGENTLSLEEFLAPGEPSADKPEATGDIEQFAEKLQNPSRITPVIDITERKAPPPSEEDMPASTGFVTPTLAEIYAKQGWYDDAIVAYKTLARIKPAERERFEKRIQELEQLKKSEEGGS